MMNCKIIIATILFIFSLTMYTIPNIVEGQNEEITFHNKKIIYDDETGNELGWNPNGNETTFTIRDTNVDRWNSLVLINLKESSDYTVCNVDYISTSKFDVTCATPPGDESRLYYMVINSEPIDANNKLFSEETKNQTETSERQHSFK